MLSLLSGNKKQHQIYCTSLIFFDNKEANTNQSAFSWKPQNNYYKAIKHRYQSPEVHQSGPRNVAFLLRRVPTAVPPHQLRQLLLTLLLHQLLRTVPLSLGLHQLGIVLVVTRRQPHVQLVAELVFVGYLYRLQQLVLFVQKVAVGLVELLIWKKVESFPDQVDVQKALGTGSLLGVHCQAKSNKIFQIFRIVKGDPVVYSNCYFLFEGVDVMSHEGRTEGSHLVQDTAHRPDIALSIVREVTPHFWTGVVGSSRLGACESTFADLADIQICQLDFLIVLCQQDVSTLDVSMEDVHPMQGLKPVQHLDSHSPDFAFGHQLFVFLIALNHPGEVSSIGKLGDQQQATGGFVVDGVLVADDVGVVDGSQDPDLIESVLHVLVAAAGNLDLLHCVYLSILLPLNLVDNCESSLPHFADRLEILHFVNQEFNMPTVSYNDLKNENRINLTQRRRPVSRIPHMFIHQGLDPQALNHQHPQIVVIFFPGSNRCSPPIRFDWLPQILNWPTVSFRWPDGGPIYPRLKFKFGEVGRDCILGQWVCILLKNLRFFDQL